MNKNIRWTLHIIVIALFGLNVPAMAAQSIKRSDLLRAQNEILDATIFVRLRDDKVLFELNADQSLIPASVAKLPIAVCSFELFGTTTNFKTPVFTDGAFRNSTIKGNLIFQGVGDPLLINEKLWQMAADLRHQGIRRVTGDLIIDNSLFTDAAHDASRNQAKRGSRNAYDAPITALAINFNTLPIAVAPNPKQQGPALVSLDPYALPSIKLMNRIQTSPKSSRSRLQVSRKTQKNETTIHLSGRISPSTRLKKVYRSVGDPIRLSGEQLRAFLQSEGLQIDGTTRSGVTSASAQKIYEIEGYPISKMVEGLNKFSNNFIADMLVKKLGASFGGQGSLEAGLSVVGQCLEQRIGKSKQRRLINGSGLDPRNRDSARSLNQLLVYSSKQMTYFPEFLSSLPIAGIDGTLKDRFDRGSSQSLRGLVRAKTGTLTVPVSVSTLAGYLNHPKHGLIAFTILQNGKTRRSQPSILDLRIRQENMLLRIYQKLSSL